MAEVPVVLKDVHLAWSRANGQEELRLPWCETAGLGLVLTRCKGVYPLELVIDCTVLIFFLEHLDRFEYVL